VFLLFLAQLSMNNVLWHPVLTYVAPMTLTVLITFGMVKPGKICEV